MKQFDTMIKGLKRCLTALAAISCLFFAASCSMDVAPEGQISDTQALDKFKDCRSFWNGLNTSMRSYTSGNYVILSDIQLDDFHAVLGNGNRLMDIYNGNLLPSTNEMASIYAGYYALIAQCNFFIDGTAVHISNNLFKSEEMDSLRNYIADAYFYRAFAYSKLADLYCKSYKHCDINAAASGLCITTHYNPNSDNNSYPGRSTLKETYDLITSDINAAIALKKESGVEMSSNHYVNSTAVNALKARVLLTMGQDREAAELADSLYLTNLFRVTPKSAFTNQWLTDEGSELIWVVEADYAHHGSATGVSFMSNNAPGADYIPTNDLIWLYDFSDARNTAYFETEEIVTTSGSGKVFRLIKYPGNRDIYGVNAQSNYVNMAKPFRSPELCLIAAEAWNNLGEEDKAKESLRPLIEERIDPSYYYSEVIPLGNDELRDFIRDERRRELVGEGFRLSDLKRWNIGFERGVPQECYDLPSGDCGAMLYNNNIRQTYEPGDYRFLWPIPKEEFDANPQIHGQQNPGY